MVTVKTIGRRLALVRKDKMGLMVLTCGENTDNADPCQPAYPTQRPDTS